jgi:hypothetical protein
VIASRFLPVGMGRRGGGERHEHGAEELVQHPYPPTRRAPGAVRA